MDAEFPGSVADGLFRERVPEISYQKEVQQDIRGYDSLRERRMVTRLSIGPDLNGPRASSRIGLAFLIQLTDRNVL